MNWLFVITAVILLYFAVRGWRRGLLRVLFSLVSVIVMMILVSVATPHISNFVKENTSIYNTIQERCVEQIQKKSESAVDDKTADSELFGGTLPKGISSYINEGSKNMLESTGVYDAVGSRIADLALAGISFFGALLFASIIVHCIGKALDIVNHIPILKGINRTLGVFAGILQGLILIWLLLLLVTLFSTSTPGQQLIHYIKEDPFVYYLYQHNGVLAVFQLFLN